MKNGNVRVALAKTATPPTVTYGGMGPATPWTFETHGGPIFGWYGASGYSTSTLLLHFQLWIDGKVANNEEAKIYEHVANEHRATPMTIFGPLFLPPGPHTCQLRLAANPSGWDSNDLISAFILEAT